MLSHYPAYEYHLAAAQLTFTMLGMGAALTIKDFINIFKFPKALLIGIVCQLLMVPAVAYIIVCVLDIHQGVAMGIIMVASLPGGSISNLYTYLGKGNAALSISLTGLVTLGCLITTPLILHLLAGRLLPENFSMPVLRIVREIALFLLIPLIVGMGIAHKFPKNRMTFSNWCIRISIFIIVLIVVGALGSGRINIMEYGITMPVLITCFSIVIGTIGFLASYFLKLSSPDGFAVGIEVMVRNTNLGLLISASLFPAVAGKSDPISAGVIYTVLYYGGNSLIASLPPIFTHRRMARKASG